MVQGSADVFGGGQVQPAGQQQPIDAATGQQPLDSLPVLVGENLGRGQHRYLIAVLDGDHAGFRGHDGLAASHVALQQAVHGSRGFHVFGDFAQYFFLRCGGLEG